jgi:hypothetical protein
MWKLVVNLNPQLQEPGRVFEKDGKVILVLKPGEQLFGLDKLNIAPPKAVPLASLIPAPKGEPVKTASRTYTDIIGWVASAVLAAVIILILLYDYFYRRKERQISEELRRDPITSGPPMVAGGVPATDTTRLARTMEAAAVNDYVRLNPNVDRSTVRVERIGPIEEGTISGEGMVGYADRARPRNIDPPQPGFRARFRFPDGREDILMSLQGCMNPCYFGEGLSGFTFTSRQAVVPTPVPPTPAPTPAPHPAMVARSIRTAAQADGNTTVSIGDKVFTFERGCHFEFDEKTGAIKLSGAQVDVTFSLKQPKAVEEGPSKATGTEK